jgi:hypothetical protein
MSAMEIAECSSSCDSLRQLPTSFAVLPSGPSADATDSSAFRALRKVILVVASVLPLHEHEAEALGRSAAFLAREWKTGSQAKT